MVTKAIIEDVLSDYEVRVRIPVLESVSDLSSQVNSAKLSSAIICTLPRCKFIPKKGDIVIVTFEDHDPSKPIILGTLQRKNSENYSDLDIQLNTDNSISTTKLSASTSIGDVKPEEIARLKNIKNNIQSELNGLQENIDNIYKAIYIDPDYIVFKKSINNNSPYIGYATDKTDGTFIISNLIDNTYGNGLAIGGTSGNLLWKGKRVVTEDDLQSIKDRLTVLENNNQ